MWMCVCLCCACVSMHTERTQQPSWSVCQKHSDSHQPDTHTQLDTDRHATATPLCGPTRYDLHLRDGTEEEEDEEVKESWTKGEWGGQETLLFVCSELPCFSPVLNCDRLRLLFGSVTLLSRGHGRRDGTQRLGKGRWGWGWGAGVGGLGKRAWADWRLKIPTRARWSHRVTVRNWWKSSGGTLGYTCPLETQPTSTSRGLPPPTPSSIFLLWRWWWLVYYLVLSHRPQQENISDMRAFIISAAH